MKRRKAALVAMIAEEESSTAEQRDAKIVTSTGQILPFVYLSTLSILNHVYTLIFMEFVCTQKVLEK